MKIKSFLAILVAGLALGLVGCKVKVNIDKSGVNDVLSPDYVGLTQDGFPIYRYKIVTDRLHDHYVYRFGSLPTTTVNSTISHGKTTSLQVVVVVDGQAYTNNMEIPR